MQQHGEKGSKETFHMDEMLNISCLQKTPFLQQYLFVSKKTIIPQ